MEKYLVPLETPCVYYHETFLSPEEADAAYQDLLQNTKWEKTAKINRWVSLCTTLTTTSSSSTGNEEASYRYRDAPGQTIAGFPATVARLQQKAQEWYARETNGASVEFNVCLLNFYENGHQRIGWHSDREEIGRDTPIVSISLGAPRSFLIRSQTDGVRDRVSLTLRSGSLLLMENACQHRYLHTVPKEPEVTEGRINLTFRCKKREDGATTAGEKEHARRDNWLERIVDGAAPDARGWSSSVAAALGNDDTADGAAFARSNTHVVFGDNVPTVELPPDQPNICFLVKTNLGAECYCAAELLEVMKDDDDEPAWGVVSRPLELDAFVGVVVSGDDTADTASSQEKKHSSPEDLLPRLLRLRTAHHVLRYHCHFDLAQCCTDEFPTAETVDGETLYQYFKRRLVEGSASISTINNDVVESASSSLSSFRVTCDRIGGPHAFNRTEVEREIGGAISEFYEHCRPKMRDYDLNIRADVIGSVVVIGTQMNVHDLSKERHFLRFRNAVTIKTNLAYAMVRCAAIQRGARIADCFCGSGTLLLEALEIYNKQLHCTGLDVSRRSVEGARENALAEGVSPEICNFVCADARALRRHLEDNSLDAIVTNLPWGVMTGHKNVSDLQTMYEIFLRTAWYVLKPKARVVMFVLRGLQLTRIVRKLGGRYRLLNVNVVRTANNLPCIVVIEKLAIDDLHESVKGQLAHLNQYVSVSPEIYEAIHMENIDE